MNQKAIVRDFLESLQEPLQSKESIQLIVFFVYLLPFGKAYSPPLNLFIRFLSS